MLAMRLCYSFLGLLSMSAATNTKIEHSLTALRCMLQLAALMEFALRMVNPNRITHEHPQYYESN